MDQNADLQHAALHAAGRQRIFPDHGVSGTRSSRPELDKMLEHLRDGDEVVVWKLDLPGRNTRNLLTLIDELEHRGVHFRIVAEGISTTRSRGRAMLTVMSAFAQLERDQLAERTRGRERPGIADRLASARSDSWCGGRASGDPAVSSFSVPRRASR